MFNAPDGFEVPVFRAALKAQLMLGAPRLFTILVCISAAIALMWRLWPLIPFLAIVQCFAAWGTRKDDAWFPIVLRALGYKNYYEV